METYLSLFFMCGEISQTDPNIKENIFEERVLLYNFSRIVRVVAVILLLSQNILGFIL